MQMPQVKKGFNGRVIFWLAIGLVALALLFRQQIDTLVGKSFVQSIASSNRAANQVTLKAKPWNEGKVHVWNNLSEDPSTTFTDVADGAHCQRVDDEMYKLLPEPVIYYYKLNCNGVVGYVETDQTE